MATYTQYLSSDSRYSITLDVNETDSGMVRTLNWVLTATKTSGSGYYNNSTTSPCQVRIDGEDVFNQNISYDFRNSTPKTITLASGSLTSNEHTFSGQIINVYAYFNSYPNSLGSATIDSTFTLNTLHTPPTINSYTITETNQKLIDAGIANNVFVQNLSKKSFNISATTYDDATLTSYAVLNYVFRYLVDTNPVVIDFSERKLRVGDITENKVPIAVGVVDSLGSSTIYPDRDLLLSDEYDAILYTNVTLDDTNTTAKRNGQISGRVNLNISGSYYNGVVGNKNQSSTYKPTIKYKFWQTGDTEPSTYAYTIPSANITISNGTFSVTDYDIGSTSESATNYFNPDYAYKVKIYVEDYFTNTTSSEKSISVGLATWTEYRDRVDFQKITINGYNPFEYSTDETIVGIWNDGNNAKPIYRKVIELTNVGRGYESHQHDISNLEDIVNVYGRFKESDVQNPVTRVVADNISTYGLGIIDITPTLFHTLLGSGVSTTNTMKIIFEYTKTTDA